jgi:anthranilate synthase component 1
MKKIRLETSCKKMLADVYTPVGIYLRLRDRFRDTILLESTDHHAAENSYSFICINAIAGIEITSARQLELKLPDQKPEKLPIKDIAAVPQLLWQFMQRFEAVPSTEKAAAFAQGLFGYTTYDAVQFFETVALKAGNNCLATQPMTRYSSLKPLRSKPATMDRHRMRL